MFRKVPLVVILGSTGTGKTKLSIELAQRFGGEIISADSMQVYKGLDIATAKATKDEQSQAPHHLLSILNPGQEYTVVNFRDNAVSIIDDLLQQNKMPIMVGGTNYYIESVLWKLLVKPPPSSPLLLTGKRKLEIDKKSDTDDDDDDHTDGPSTSDTLSIKRTSNENLMINKQWKSDMNFPDLIETHKTSDDDGIVGASRINKIELIKYLSTHECYTSVELHQLLTKLDPATAQRLHPNNKRKIIRALEVYTENDKPLSSILEAQRATDGGNSLGGPLRYDHVILLWLRCEQEVLNERLDKRVDGMLADGLLQEVRDFYDEFIKLDRAHDFTKGMLQIIGFKELFPYLSKYDKTEDERLMKIITDHDLTGLEHSESLKMLYDCLEQLKLATRQYSKRQIKWINNRLLGSKNRIVPPIYSLNTTDPSVWQNEIYTRAENIVLSYIDDLKPQTSPMAPYKSIRDGLNEEVSNFCDICQRHFVGEYQWGIHLKSNKHRNAIRHKLKRELKNKNND